MTKKRSIGFVAAALTVASAVTAVCFGDSLGMVGAGPDAVFAASSGGAPADPLDVLRSASPWVTPVPGGVQTLRGKVVLVNFWTYSCINSLRALPYLRAWSERYSRQGLVVIGVHAPEFQFEKDAAKVRLALDQLDVLYPNVQDNDYSVWRKLGNQGWPGFYLIDANGRVRDYKLGEGDYDGAEQTIRRLLAEAGQDTSAMRFAPISGIGIQAEAAWRDLASPETYVGYAKAENFASPGGISEDATHVYAAATSLSRNQWDLVGHWTIGSEFAILDAPSGLMRFRSHARDLHLVLGGAHDAPPVRFRVRIDGAVPAADHGSDVDADGWGEVKEDRLYHLVRQKAGVRDCTVTIEFERPGVRAYVFTFG